MDRPLLHFLHHCHKWSEANTRDAPVLIFLNRSWTPRTVLKLVVFGSYFCWLRLEHSIVVFGGCSGLFWGHVRGWFWVYVCFFASGTCLAASSWSHTTVSYIILRFEACRPLLLNYRTQSWSCQLGSQGPLFMWISWNQASVPMRATYAIAPDRCRITTHGAVKTPKHKVNMCTSCKILVSAIHLLSYVCIGESICN